jgi:hypothetical protein
MKTIADKLAVENPIFQRVYLGRYPYSLVKSGNLAKYYQLLTNFEFLTAKLNHPEFGVQSLIADYDLLDDAKLLTHPEYTQRKSKR